MVKNKTDMVIRAVKQAVIDILLLQDVNQDVIDKVKDLPKEDIEPYFCSTDFQNNETQPSQD